MDELQKDLTERVSENPLAYSGNKLHFGLTQDDIREKKALWQLLRLKSRDKMWYILTEHNSYFEMNI